MKDLAQRSRTGPTCGCFLWAYNIDAAARTLLEAIDWQAPDPDALPTRRDLVRDYLAPLAVHPALAPNIVYGATVEAVTRSGLDRVASSGRDAVPFSVRWRERRALSTDQQQAL